MQNTRVTVRRVGAGAVLVGLLAGGSLGAQNQRPYFPTTDASWTRRRPAEVGLDSARLSAAIAWAQAQVAADGPPPKDAAEMVAGQERMLREQMGEPQPVVLGPMMPPRGVNGLVLRNGYIVAEFGDTKYVETTASLTKSIVSTVAGLAFDRKLVRDLDEPVGKLVKDSGYASPHNAKITWRHHLQQTSEWEGELWGMTDVNDRRGPLRTAASVEPGTRYGYNDVRVNRLALSLLRLFNRPIPEVLKESVMDPIGASSTWQWHGYRTSWLELNGRRVQSVSGGAHWGGGFWVNSYDLGRLGLLYLRRGVWNDKRILSEDWIRLATTPSSLRPDYGFLWWLNTNGTLSAKAPRSAYAMMGGGGYYCWVDPEHDMVVVVKALGGGAPRLGGFIDRVMDAVVSR